MPFLDQSHVLVEGATVLWDAITRPDRRDDGSTSHKLKIAIPAGNPAIAEIEQLAQQTLAESKWRGVLPSGATWAITPIAPGEYGDQFVGGYVINPSSNRVPDTYDDAGNLLQDSMQYAPLLYQGQLVSVIVHCWSFDNRSKGIATGLDGVRIHVSASAPRQQFGGGGFNAAGVFGGQPQPQAQPQSGFQPQPQAQPQSGFQPQGQPQPQPQPQQATNFLPNR